MVFAPPTPRSRQGKSAEVCGSLDPDMKRESISIPVTLLDADVTQMSQKDQIKARSEGLFYVTDGDQKKPFALDLDALTAGEIKTISEAADAIAKHFGIYTNAYRGESCPDDISKDLFRHERKL